MVQFRLPDGYYEYHDALKFCYDTWGMSLDVETYNRLHSNVKVNGGQFEFSAEWSYLDRYGDHRIYLTDAAASWIRLSGVWGV